MVSRILYFYPFLNLGIWSNLTRAFWNGLNHQLLGLVYLYLYINQYFIKCVVLAFACSMSLESSTTSRKFPRHTWIPNTRYYSIYMAKKKWGTGVTSHKWSYFTLLMNGFWAHLVPKLTKKTSSQPFRANLAHGWRARRARVLGELHSHRVVSLFGGDRFKHGIPGKPQGFVKLQWSIEDNPNSSKLSIGDHVQMAVWHWLWVMSYGQYQISLII